MKATTWVLAILAMMFGAGCGGSTHKPDAAHRGTTVNVSKPAIEALPSLDVIDGQLARTAREQIAREVSVVERAIDSLQTSEDADPTATARLAGKLAAYQQAAGEAEQAVALIEPQLLSFKQQVVQGDLAAAKLSVQNGAVSVEDIERARETAAAASVARQELAAEVAELSTTSDDPQLQEAAETLDEGDSDDEKSIWEKIGDVLIFILRVFLLLFQIFGSGDTGPDSSGPDGTGQDGVAVAAQLADTLRQPTGIADPRNKQQAAEPGLASDRSGDFHLEVIGAGADRKLRVAREGDERVVQLGFGDLDEMFAVALKHRTLMLEILEQGKADTAAGKFLRLKATGLPDGAPRLISWETADSAPAIEAE